MLTVGGFSHQLLYDYLGKANVSMPLISGKPLGAPLGMPANKVCQLYGCVSFEGVSVLWVCQLYGCVSSKGVSAIWVCQLYGCVSLIGVSPYRYVSQWVLQSMGV